MHITDRDKATELHAKLVDMYQTRLQSLRVRLETTQSELSTEKTRGKIDEVKRLLKWLMHDNSDADSNPRL